MTSRMISVLVLASMALCLGGCKTRQNDVLSPEDHPGQGDAVDVPCSELQLKLLAKPVFYHAIGNDETIESGSGEVFCLIRLEWIPRKQEAGRNGEKKPTDLSIPSLRVVDDDGGRFDQNPEARAVYIRMQKRADTEEEFVESATTITSRSGDVRVFQVDPSKAFTGLYLEAQGRECSEWARIRLGKWVVQ